MITKETLTRELNHLKQQRENYQQLCFKADGAIQVLEFLLTQVETEGELPATPKEPKPATKTTKTRK